MKRLIIAVILIAPVVLIGAGAVAWMLSRNDQLEEERYRLGETKLIVADLTHASLTLYKGGKTPADTARVTSFDGTSIWLSPANYFLEVVEASRRFFIPVPLTGYRCGPDEDGAFNVTIRPGPKEYPPRLLPSIPEYMYIPSGSFLLGDRLNPREPHYVWLTGYFIAPFEATNGEFREFLNAPDGYRDNSNWTVAGNQWKESNESRSTATLNEDHPEFPRFGHDDQPVVWVTWHEAIAFCRWLSKKIGGGRWLFSLPSDAEWEKAARGPDNLDYALSMTISDNEIPLYNWRKNPDSPVTVVGIKVTPVHYRANRYGLYHITGNVVEWTQSINMPFNRDHPFVDDDRNHAATPGLRTARGGSWYSASTAYLYIPYRDAFQPEHSTQDIGFRVVARALP